MEGREYKGYKLRKEKKKEKQRIYREKRERKGEEVGLTWVGGKDRIEGRV